MKGSNRFDTDARGASSDQGNAALPSANKRIVFDNL
jgi:hypothetical protein